MFETMKEEGFSIALGAVTLAGAAFILMVMAMMVDNIPCIF